MSNARADKGATPPKKASATTPYVIFVPVQDTDLEDQPVTLWKRARTETIDAHGAHDAIRRWAKLQGDGWAGGQVMAVPTRSLTIVDVQIETRRQLHLGTA